MMFNLVFILFLSIFHCIQSNPNQNKPFGTIGSLKPIEELHGKYPNSLEFFSKSISQSEPILVRQVLNNDLYFNIWKTDEQLEHEVDGLGKVNVYVEAILVQQRKQMKFGEFLDHYQKDHLFLADNLPKILRKYIVVPHPLQCDAVLSALPSVSLVMNDVSTSPLIFNTEYDPLLCLYRGNKRVVLVNSNKYPDVRQYVTPSKQQTREPPINPDRVDLNQFPALANIDYHVANITAGDCLLIPSGWIFQERSLDSTISIIYNLDHQQAINVDLKDVKTCDTHDPSFTLDQIDWSNIDDEPRSLKDVMMKLINSKSNNFEKWQQTFSKYFSFDLSTDSETAGIFDEFYGIIDVNGDGEVTATEVEQINGVHQHHISDLLYEMARTVNDKRTGNAKKDVPVENEDVDEELNLDDYKSEL